MELKWLWGIQPLAWEMMWFLRSHDSGRITLLEREVHFPLSRTTTSELSCLTLGEGSVDFGLRVIASNSERVERWITRCLPFGLVRCSFLGRL